MDGKNLLEQKKDEHVVKKVNKSFKSPLDMYPTKNLEELLDELKGNRMIIRTDTGIEQMNDPQKPLKSEGMLLYINTRTKKGYGYYYIDHFYEEPASNDKEDRYPVYNDKGIHLRESTGDAEFDKKIENFQFLVQYADLKALNKKELIYTKYDPTNDPSFALEYKLSNDEELLKKLRQEYGFTDKKDPTISIYGVGKDWDSPVYELYESEIQINFSNKPSEDIDSSIIYDNNWKEEAWFWGEERLLQELEQ